MCSVQFTTISFVFLLCFDFHLEVFPLTDHTPDGVVAFCCGSELLNPVPVFIVARISPDLVGGFISAFIHT
jgi:hypothetical protein